LSVVTHRHRTLDPQGKKVVTRTYTFGATGDPISGGIKNSQIYPGTQPIYVKHVYECITRRLEQLAIDKQVRVRDWQNLQTLISDELSSAIHIDDFASIKVINLPKGRSGSAEFSLENLRSVAQTLLHIGQMKADELKTTLDEYLSAIEAEVIRVALQLVERKYFRIFDRLRQHFDLASICTEGRD
jgi:hypothetical protein